MTIYRANCRSVQANAQYGRVCTEKPVAEVSDADVDEAIQRIADQNRSYTAKGDGAKAEKDDRVTINFKGTINGTPFDGGTGGATSDGGKASGNTGLGGSSAGGSGGNHVGESGGSDVGESGGATVDPSTGSIALRALFPNPKKELMPGMFVRARLEEGVNPEALLVPQQAVTRDQKGLPFALVVGPDRKVERRPLVTDRAIGDAWLVTSGVQAGDQVIVEGLQKVRPGAEVNPVPAATAKQAAR